MIEGDIEERMSGFAPSQRTGPSDLAREIMSQQVAGPSMEPTVPEPSPLAREIMSRDNDALMSSLMGAVDVNPDEAAKASRIGAQLGVGQDIALRNMPEMEHRARMMQLRQMQIQQRDPILAEFMSNQAFARMAYDDLPNLSVIGRAFRFVRDIPTGISEGFTKAVSQAEMAQIFERQRERGGYLEEYEKAALRSYQQELSELSRETGLAEQGSYLVSQQLTDWRIEDVERVVTGGVIGGGAGFVGGPLAPATVPAGIALGLKAGFATTMLERSRRMETASLYGELEPELGHDLANKIAFGAGILNASLDVGSLGLITAPLRAPLKAAFGQSVKEAVRKRTVRDSFARFGLWYAGSVAAETGTETLQELNNVLAMELGLYLQDKPLVLSTPEGRAEVAERLAATAVETALGMVTVGLPGPAVQFYSDVRGAARAMNEHKKLENITKAVSESKLLPRNSAALESYIASTAEGSDASTVFIDAATTNDILRQSGLTDVELDAALPGVRQQIETLQEKDIPLGGSDITIPMEQFTVRIAKTPLQEQLKQHARLSAGAPSFLEAQRIRAELAQTRAEAEQILATKQEADAAFVAEAQQVEDEAFEQVRAVGQFTDIEARTIAKLRQAMVVVDAAEAGMTPAQYQRERGVPLQVRGVQGEVAPVAPLEQASRIDADYLAAVERGDMAITWAERNESWPEQIVQMTPRQYLALTRAKTVQTDSIDRAVQILASADGNPIDPISIRIDADSGAVLEQEGNHRAISALLAGNKSVPVYVSYWRNGQSVTPQTQNLPQPWNDVSATALLPFERTTGVRDEAGNVVPLSRRFDITSPKLFEQAAMQPGQQATLTLLQMQAKRGIRRQARKVQLSPNEEAAIATAASEFGESAAEIREAVLNHKKAHPTAQGWAPLEFVKVVVKDRADKGKKGLGLEKLDLQYRQIPYAFHRDKSGAALLPGTTEYQTAVTAIARRMVDEVRAVLRRANAGDQNALRIINQSTWYKAMREALRREFGGLGDLFADLLGATSPNTPVRGNWDFALDVLRRATRGDFDVLITKWEAWVETIERLETDLRAYVNDEMLAMESRGEKPTQAAIQRKPEYVSKLTALKAARELPDDLLPRQENGKKYGFNGGNVVRAMVGLWRTVREQNTLLGTTAQAPKALNFSGNLIGFRARATIDVWAARMLQRLAALLRIPSMAETGVAGDMLPDGSTTGQFGFGQDVFAEAAQRIRNDAELNQNSLLAQLNDDDLQALVWFIEKELWTINNWTSVAGEGGSFELEASLAGISDREMVTRLRKTIDAGVPGAIQAEANRLPAAQQALINWKLDPAKAGWRQRIADLQSELAAIPATLTKKEQRERRSEITKRLDAALRKSGFEKIEQSLSDAIKADLKVAQIEEARKAAQAKLISMERRVDRYTAGLSQQQALESQGVDYVPTDADQARLADNVRLRAYRADRGELLVAIKSLSTEGRYGSIERSIDLEVIARQGWSPNELWQVMLEEARTARQESTFLSRVLRAGETIDPTRHRPGLEIYFRSPIPRSELDALINKLNENGVDFFTVIVDARRSTEAQSGAMADAVGIRMQYIPEFMQRYGIEDFSGLSEAEIASRVKEKEAEWLLLADNVRRVMPEVSFAGVFWHETRVAFADAYESEINAITTRTTTGDGGLPAGTQWAGQSISEGLAAANRFVESRAARAEPDGGGQVLGGVQEGDRGGFAEPGVRTGFEQAAFGPARGGIDPRTLNILVGKGGDVSTLVHELIHLRIGEYLRMARGTTPPARITADLDILFGFMGVKGDTFQERLDNYETMPLEQRRPLEEKVTYNAEIYVYEGKAPSVELRGVFDRLAAWMRRVYKSIRDDLNAIYRREFGTDLPILTPEVRSVFDRMLASEEQIKRQEAINGMKGLFQTQAESGMDDAEWAAYQAMQQEATEAAVTDLNTASMRQVQWLGNARARILRDLQKKHDAKRKEVTAEVAAALKVEPVYRAMTYLRTGKFIDAEGNEIDAERDVVSASLMELARSMGGAGVEVQRTHRLDIKKVRAMYAGLPSAEAVEVIRATGMAVPTNVRPDIAKLGTGKNGMMGLDGLDPDVVAEMFGYSSGDEMVRALLAAKPMKEAVAERTDAEMLRRYGDMNTPAALEAEVQKALHNEARARFVAVELRHIAKATQPVRVMLETAKQVAADMIADTTIRDLRPGEFVAAEARAARDAERIQRTYGITEPAPELAQRYGTDRQQALIRAKRAQLYQNQLAAEALRVKEYVDKQVKYLRRVLRDENVKRMGAAAADQIAGLLERFEVAQVSLKRLEERRSMAQYLADLEAAGVVPDIAEEIADESRRVNYKQLKVSEFRDLVDAVRQIEHVGKNEQKMRLAEERAAFEEVRDEIVTRIRAVGKVRGLKVNPRTPLTGIGRAAAFLRGFAAQHLKAASVARILDGGKEDGPLWNTIIRTANNASDMETRMRAEASLKLGEILKPVFALGGMGGKGMYFPSINRSLNREARIAIALNLGNDGNRQRLLDGEGWTLEQLQPVLESLTEAEWLAVQQVWDFIDGYRPEIAAKERRLYGKEPTWVTPVPFTVRTSDGKEVSLQGGYYPVKYDPVASDRVATVDAVEEAKRDLQGAYTAATTRRSFVKARAKEVRDRPILYTLDAAFSGVNDVIHDLAWHEWLISTNRLLRDVKFANAVRETRGPEFLKQLRDWTKDNATGARGQQVAGEAVLSWLRQGISASGLGFNVVSAAMQVTGFNQSIVRVGAKYVGQGIAQFSTRPFESARMVAEKSSFMAERGRTQFREINEIKNRVRGQTEVARRVTAGTYFLMMNMQRSVDIPTWLGAYQKALDAGKDDARAVALADQAVRDSQGSGLVSDLAAVERGGPAMKLFTVFYSYMNTVYNMTAVQTMTARGKGKLAADYAMLLVVPVVLGYAIKSVIQPDAGDDELDPEALARKLAAEELSYLMGTMVIAREFGGAAQLLTGAEGVRMGYGGPAGLRAVGEVYGLATQAGQLEFDRAFRRSAINTLGAFTGLPSAQINRTIDGIEALVEGEVEGPTAVLAPLTGVQR